MYGTCVQEVVCVYSEPLLSATIVYVSYTHTRHGYVRTYVWYMCTRGGVCIQRTALIHHNWGCQFYGGFAGLVDS